jgi:hypothetical protein
LQPPNARRIILARLFAGTNVAWAHAVDFSSVAEGNDGGEGSVDLSRAEARFKVEWIHPIDGTTAPAEPVAGGGQRTLKASHAGAAVVYLQSQAATKP